MEQLPAAFTVVGGEVSRRLALMRAFEVGPAFPIPHLGATFGAAMTPGPCSRA